MLGVHPLGKKLRLPAAGASRPSPQRFLGLFAAKPALDAPCAAAEGPSDAVNFSSAAELVGVATLRSLAPSDDAVRDGALVLTDAVSSQERALVVDLPAMAGRRYFDANFELSIGGGTGGEGVSVCLGRLPDAPFGEDGAGDGLRVLLLSGRGFRCGRRENRTPVNPHAAR